MCCASSGSSVELFNSTLELKCTPCFAGYQFWVMGKEKVKDRIAAQQMFVEWFLDAKTIAEKLNIQENTIGTWRKKYEWDKLRETTVNNPVKMKSLIAQNMMLVIEGKQPNFDADALAKMFKVYEGLSDKINPGIANAIMTLYDEWLAQSNPKLAVENLAYNKQFLVHIINTYG